MIVTGTHRKEILTRLLIKEVSCCQDCHQCGASMSINVQRLKFKHCTLPEIEGTNKRLLIKEVNSCSECQNTGLCRFRENCCPLPKVNPDPNS